MECVADDILGQECGAVGFHVAFHVAFGLLSAPLLAVHAGGQKVNPRVRSLLFRMGRSLWKHAYVALLPNTNSVRVCTFRHQLLL